jgi:hypothetical protein
MTIVQRNTLADLVADLDDAHATIVRHMYSADSYDWRTDDAIDAIKAAADYLHQLRYQFNNPVNRGGNP